MIQPVLIDNGRVKLELSVAQFNEIVAAVVSREKHRDYAYAKGRSKATTTKQTTRRAIKIRFLPIEGSSHIAAVKSPSPPVSLVVIPQPVSPQPVVPPISQVVVPQPITPPTSPETVAVPQAITLATTPLASTVY